MSFISGNIQLNGVNRSIGSSGSQVELVQGTFPIQVVVPSGFEFVRWAAGQAGIPGEGVTVQNVNANPTNITITGQPSPTITAWIRPVVVVVSTRLTISGPSSVEPGASITITGRLTRPDTGVGIANGFITLEQPLGNAVSSGRTDSNGNYSISVTAPMSEGTLQFRTSFAATAGLGASQSAVMGIGIGEPSNLPLLVVLGAAAFFLSR